ncbi:unnamed protein product [Ambrosiozyma monospora]|uniref:Unnamed protein product n=1 Tax=Ambrosiozyma monospora TaxID=43982 RepID=A0ACB5U222_AMBMO|nr:unnamed protein product [Ambrosiozyma monospora]
MAYAEFITFLNGSIGDTYPEFMFTCLKSINEFTNLVCLRLELRGNSALGAKLSDSIEHVKSWLASVKKAGSKGGYINDRKPDKTPRLKVIVCIRFYKTPKPEIIDQLKDMLSGTRNPNVSLELQLNIVISSGDDAEMICELKSVKQLDFYFRSPEETKFIHRIAGLKSLTLQYSGFDYETYRSSQVALVNPTVENLTLNLNSLSRSNFNLAKLTSLQTLSLVNCDLSDENLFDNISNHLKVLCLRFISFSVFEMKLPIHLCQLNYSIDIAAHTNFQYSPT